MQSQFLRPARSIVALSAALLVAAACSDSTNPTGRLNSFQVTRLVADLAAAGATTTDVNLQNAWGVAFGPTGNVWVADNHTGLSTVYGPNGLKLATTVSILASGGATGGSPTGLVANSTTSFNIGTTGPATFLFAGEDGTVSAWNAASGATANLVIDASSTGAVYKAIAIAPSNGANALYLADFHNARIDVYNGTFGYVKSFTDATIPSGFAPFGIANVNGLLYVTYARQLGPDNEDDQAGAGNGYVDVFNPDGSLVSRFASNGKLNSPWAIAMAPSGFSGFGGALLVGNFGDGRILAFDATTGAFIDYLRDSNSDIITIDGLWALAFGPTSGSTTMYFAAGPNDETNGLVGTITPR
ncbi:MAG TPA: TIGR03118 family protein [Gemmatimonadaceae bacterium]|nr:TIGR03118 family protein [Gemmatimonadaceae bacterium]